MRQAFSVLISGLTFWLLYSFVQNGEITFDTLRANALAAVIFVVVFALAKTAMAFIRRT